MLSEVNENYVTSSQNRSVEVTTHPFIIEKYTKNFLTAFSVKKISFVMAA